MQQVEQVCLKHMRAIPVIFLTYVGVMTEAVTPASPLTDTLLPGSIITVLA